MNKVRDRIERHFQSGKRSSLMETIIKEWSDDELLDCLELPHRSIRKLAYDRLKQLMREQDLTSVLMRGLRGSAAMKSGLLTALSTLPLEAYPCLEEAVLGQLQDSDIQVRCAAARVVAFQHPQNIGALFELLHLPGFSEILRLVCYSDQMEWIPEIARMVGFPDQRLPPAIGVLVDQFWLANNYAKHPELASHIAVECGFSEIPISDRVIELWHAGLSCVTRPLAASHGSGWQQQLRKFAWSLIPNSYLLSDGEEFTFDVNDVVSQDLFLSAVRDSDRAQIPLLRNRHPFSIKFRPSSSNAICCHAKLFFARQLFIERALTTAAEIEVEADQFGEFVFDHARTQLILDADDRAESEASLRARWLVRSRKLGKFRRETGPICTDVDFPEAKLLVLSEVPRLCEADKLSKGSRAICNLGQAAGIRGIEAWLVESESIWKQFLIPIGMELQVPLMNPNHIIAWKQALRYLGVNSPRRPEYHKMTEAAFLPVPTFHAAALGPWLLHQIGMMEYEQDMAVHLSFQGDLGDAVRYLVFPQLFIHPSQRSRKRPRWTIAPLMSKGMVNLNRDVVDCVPDLPATCRTEVRIFRCVANLNNDHVELDTSYIDDVVSNHILASAISSPMTETDKVLETYFSEVREFATEMGPEFERLLNANFYESTGEPEDVEMLEYIPILAERSKARSEFSKRHDPRSVENHFLKLRIKCIRKLVDMWFDANDHGLAFTDMICKIPFPRE